LRILSAVVISALIGSCAPPVSLLDQIRSSGELRVITRNSPTTFYYGANEAAFGVEYELAQAFADHLGVQLDMVMAEDVWQIVPTLAEHRMDIAAAGLSVADTHGEDIVFGPVYQFVTAQVIYRMGAERPESLDDLLGAKLEVRSGSNHVGMLIAARATLPELNWAENGGTSAEALMHRVADGVIDYAIVDSNEFNLLQDYYPEVQVAFDLEQGSSLAWALPHGATDLREEVARFFARIQATGELDQILDRYYLARRDFDFVDQISFVRHLRERFPLYQASFAAAERETGIDWRLLAAIAYQESHWDADAVSPTGVKGLMMLTASTAKIMDVKDRSDPHQSIMGGARYLLRVLEKFPERIPSEDRLMMAVAAYNIGFGHVEDARIITESKDGDIDSWEDVRANLPLLAEEKWYSGLKRGYAQGSVPVQYVDNVLDYYWLLERLKGTEIFAALPEPDAADSPRDPT
jgi:membrane-bound lytic murein transglycosylase F